MIHFTYRILHLDRWAGLFYPRSDVRILHGICLGGWRVTFEARGVHRAFLREYIGYR